MLDCSANKAVKSPPFRRQEVIKQILKDGIIDAHHHSLSHKQRQQNGTGLWAWLSDSYMGLLIRASAIDPLVLFDDVGPIEQRIEMLMELLSKVRATTYYRVARQGLLASVGFDLCT